jgi:hypothetical protein
MNVDVNDQWLGRMQQELGVLSSNVMLLNLQRDALAAKVALDAELIDALKKRCLVAESANEELRAQLQPEVKARQRTGSKPNPLKLTGKDDVPNQDQPT